MAKVYVLCGRLCSGKSTYAARLRKERRAVVLSTDEITLALFGQDAGEKMDDYVARTKAYFYRKSLEILESGIDVVLDWGCWTRRERHAVRRFYTDRGFACEIHYLDIDDEEWLRRLEKRNRDVLEGRVSAYYVDEGLTAKFRAKFEPPDESEIDVWIRQ